MTNLQLVPRRDFTVDPLELLRDQMADQADGWAEVDATHVEIADPDRVAQLVGARAARDAPSAQRSFLLIRRSTHSNDVPAAGLRTSGRYYSLALLALVGAVAAEPSCSPLAVPLPLDDLRATAFFVAAESVSGCPDLSLVDRSVEWVDHCLAGLRMPLRATGYLMARDALRAEVDLLAGARLS